MQPCFRFYKVCAKNGRNLEPYRGSAEAVLGPASSPPTSAIGLLRSPEQVAYLFPVSVSQPTNGFDHAGGWEELCKGRTQLCNRAGIKAAAELPLPVLLLQGGGREESTAVFLFAP